MMMEPTSPPSRPLDISDLTAASSRSVESANADESNRSLASLGSSRGATASSVRSSRARPSSNSSNVSSSSSSSSSSFLATAPPRASATRSNSNGGGHRSSIFGRMSSGTIATATTGGGGLRESFFGKTKSDPLEDSAHNEFNLTVIDEEGLIHKPLRNNNDSTSHNSNNNAEAEADAPGRSEGLASAQLFSLRKWYNDKWSTAGWIVFSIALVTVVSTYIATLLSPKLDGYEIDPGLVLGSLQTLLLCAVVIITYHGVQVFQAHPNPIILYKCLIDSVLAMRFLLDPWLLRMGIYETGNRESCAYLSGFTQFLYISSDCWYFALIFDLYKSLKNPFTSVQADRQKYMFIIFGVGFVSALLTITVKSFHGFADGNYCWTHRGESLERNFWKLNVASWTLFYDWMIVFYLSGIAVLLYGRRRLRSGLKLTLDSRLEMRRHSAISIMSFTGYWTIAFTWYAISFSARTHYEKDDGQMSPSKVFRSYSYTLAGRGLVDYFVWFMINKPYKMKKQWMKFTSQSADTKFSAQLNSALQRELIFFTNEGMIKAVELADDELLRKRAAKSPTTTQEQEDQEQDARSSTVSFERPSDVPVMQLNRHSNSSSYAGSDRTFSMADVPRSSTATSVTEAGEVAGEEGEPAMLAAKPKGMGAPRRSFLSYLGFASGEQKQPLPPLGARPASSSSASASTSTSTSTSSKYISEQHIKFTPYKSQAFAELRSSCGIKTNDFMESFESSTKPSISEGASGAFMFFSGDKKFIVKSMAENEARFLCDIADEYVDYLIRCPWSLITKFYGCFKITLYDKKFYFVVMENLFDTNEAIHHRYDIKGSWVNRSYSRPRKGAKLKCRHCSMQFIYGNANKALLQCPNVVGRHEPNVVLKDNDLRTRMRIGEAAGQELYATLRDDSLFLCSLGIMDYSLLLGVSDIEFFVDQPPAAATEMDGEIHENRRNTVTSMAHSMMSTATTRKTRTGSGNTVASHVSSTMGGGGGGSASSLRLDEEVAMTSEALAAHDLSIGVGVGSRRPPTHSFVSSSSASVSEMGRPPLAPGSATGRGAPGSGAPGKHPPTTATRAKTSVRKSESVFGPAVYHIGIIDILQQWNTKKQMERFWKVNVQRCDGNGLSAIDPDQYQRRFEAKLREIIAIPKEPMAQEGEEDQEEEEEKQAVVVASAGQLQAGVGAVGAAAGARQSLEALASGRGGGGGGGGGARRMSYNHQGTGSRLASMEDDEDAVDLEQGSKNPEPILIRVGSSQRRRVISVSASVGGTGTGTGTGSNIQAF